MASLTDTLSADLRDAMRAGDQVRRDEIRGLLAALQAERQTKLTRALSKQGLIVHGDDATLTPEQQAAVQQIRATTDLTADEEQAVLRQRAKQHRQSIDGFRQGKRADLETIEEAQLAVLDRYLPRQMSAEEVEAAIRAAIASTGATGARDQGKVMGQLSAQLRGRADMKAVSARVQQVLG
ncbi:MAG: GatB/YqeY domain-containing protein [Chloroflexi bacterium]|nr:GatB/YqeY domain-containing protein [Chloroflexota bacterium]